MARLFRGLIRSTLPPMHAIGQPPDRATTPALHLRDLTLRYDGRVLFERLTLTVEAGQFMVLLGPSGVGKSSLLRIAAGLAAPERGHVGAGDGRALHGRIAYMGQQDLLFPWASVLGNVVLGDRLRGVRPDRARARALLGRVGLADRAEALPADLSGGMRQRVALARTLYEDRPFVLMDEPFSALDTVTRATVQDLAAELLRGRTVLMITHDPLEACRLGDVLVVLSGSPAALGAAIAVPGAAPRPPDDPALLHTQGRLMRMLTR